MGSVLQHHGELVPHCDGLGPEASAGLLGVLLLLLVPRAWCARRIPRVVAFF